MFYFIFPSPPIRLIFGQIGYWDDTRQYIFYFFYLSIISVITILPKTTFLHVKMTAFQSCPVGKSYQNRFLWVKWSYNRQKMADPPVLKRDRCIQHFLISNTVWTLDPNPKILLLLERRNFTFKIGLHFLVRVWSNVYTV